MANNKSNVSVGKPKKIGGAIFRAPKNTTPPTSASTELGSSFACLGYISEDGVTNSNNKEITKIKAWGGDVVATPVTGHTDNFTMNFIESLNPEVLKTAHGDDNVTGAIATGLAVSVNGADDTEHVYVIDMLLKGNVKKRIVIPSGIVTSVGDVVYKDNTVIAYPITISAGPDSSENTHYEYMIQATGTTGATGAT